jgi:Amt family ammonium transporter
LGLFATGQYGAPGPTGPDTSAGVVTGLFYGGGTSQLIAQAVGSACIGGASFITALAMMYALKALGVLRLSAERELAGMDISEHGGPAYPDLVPLDGADPRRVLVSRDPSFVADARR